MANPSYLQDIGNAWSSSTFDGTHDGHKDYQGKLEKYFTKDNKGRYVLNNGYEQREQSNSNNSLGAEVVYSNYEEDHEDGSDNNHFGIYKVQQPKTTVNTVYKDKPVAAKPKPKPEPTGPVEYSPEIQQAKERVNKYQDDVMSGKTSEEIYAKDSYINRDHSGFQQKYDFSNV